MEKKEVISKLMKNGAINKGLIVRSVNVVPLENYIRVSLGLDRPIKGYIADENGKYTEGETKVVFISMFSIMAVLKEDENISFVANHLLKHPEGLQVLLSGAKIDVLQEAVAEGQEYSNPWSDNPTPSIIAHDTYINHVTDIRLTDRAFSIIDKLSLSLVGI